MKIITQLILAKEAPKRWRKQYSHTNDAEKKEITRQLDALEDLGMQIQPETIDAIIGNRSWTRIGKCDECGIEEPPMIVEVGEEPDYESHTTYLCISCLEAAVKLARSV